MSEDNTPNDILVDVQTALGVTKDSPLPEQKTAIIKLYIKLASKSVALYCGEKYDKLPNELTGVITEMALAKFAKRGNEGKTSAAEEGLTDQWNVDDMAPYITQLNAYKSAKNNGGILSDEGQMVSFD